MVFSSIIFLWVLLPCILLLYYVSPKPFKNGILTVNAAKTSTESLYSASFSMPGANRGMWCS